MTAEPARVWVLDPPWLAKDQLPGPGRGAAKRYRCMTTAEICKFEPPALEKDCAMLLWRLACMQSDALAVVAAHGFVLKTELIWKKLTKHGKRHFGMGRYLRAEHETCLIATRGRVRPLSRSIRSTFEAPLVYLPSGRIWHSAKPEAFYGLVERLFAGPYHESFARGPRRAGWSQDGDQLEAADYRQHGGHG